tara:strand:+ start:939 stop:1097 length:159 start_codon:yes stop_codon:yes gene_type:complete
MPFPPLLALSYAGLIVGIWLVLNVYKIPKNGNEFLIIKTTYTFVRKTVGMNG